MVQPFFWNWFYECANFIQYFSVSDILSDVTGITTKYSVNSALYCLQDKILVR